MKKLLLGMTLLVSMSALATSYSCHVIGSHKNYNGEIAKVDVNGISVEVDASRSILFGRIEEPEFDGDTRPETMPWSLSIRNKKDGGETPMVLSLGAPNQNSIIGYAYTEADSKYIGFTFNDSLEALCIKN